MRAESIKRALNVSSLSMIPLVYNRENIHLNGNFKIHKFSRRAFHNFRNHRARSYLVAMQLAICNSLEIIWKMKRARLYRFCALLISHAISSELQIASCIATKYERALSLYFSISEFIKLVSLLFGEFHVIL